MRDIYLDVDGVLNRLDTVTKDGSIPWRRDAKIFLLWALEHFKCHWLTAWDSLSVEHQLLPELGLKDRVKDFHFPLWTYGKPSGINFSRPFYWIDDNRMEGEMIMLREHEAEQNFIQVDPDGEEALREVATKLALRERRNYGNNIPDLSGQAPRDPA